MSKLFVNTIAPNSGDTVTISGSLSTTGKLTIGDNANDTVAITAEITSSLIPDLDDKFDLGSSTKQWKDLHIDGIANIDSASIDTASIAHVDGHLIPSEDDTYDLGSSPKQWRNLYIDGLANIDSADINNLVGVSTATITTGSITNIICTGSLTANLANIDVLEGVATASITSGSFTNINTNNITASIGKITNAQVTNLTASGLIRANGNIVGDNNTNISGINNTTTATGSITLLNASHVSSSTIQAATSLTVATNPNKKVTITNGNISASNSITSSVVFANHSLSTPLATITTLNATNSTLGTGSFSVLTSSLIPAVDDQVDLGSSGKQWKNLFIDGTANIDTLAGVGNATIAGTASITNVAIINQLRAASLSGSLIPLTHNLSSLGSSAKEFKESFIGTGSFSYLTSSLIPAVNNQVNIGSSTKKWNTVFTTNVTASGNITGSTIELSGDISAKSISITKATAASVDASTYSINGSKVEVRTQLQAQLDDGTFAAFKLHNTSIATDSVVMGAFTGGTVGGITGSFISANTIAASTASFRIHNETGANVTDNTGFTASFVIL